MASMILMTTAQRLEYRHETDSWRTSILASLWCESYPSCGYTGMGSVWWTDAVVSMTSPTQLSLALLRKDGWTAWIVEHWNPYSKVRVDLFNFIDIIAIHPENGILGVQTTTATNVAARRKKILENEYLETWLSAGGGVEIHGWRKRLIKRGGKAMRWECSREQVHGNKEIPQELA